MPAQRADAPERRDDTEGVALASLPAPRAKRTLQARGTPLRRTADQPALFAVVATYGPWRRSTLHVYESSRALLYAEILLDVCAGIAALPAPGGGPEALLVSCGAVVWRYDLG